MLCCLISKNLVCMKVTPFLDFKDRISARSVAIFSNRSKKDFLYHQQPYENVAFVFALLFACDFPNQLIKFLPY